MLNFICKSHPHMRNSHRPILQLNLFSSSASTQTLKDSSGVESQDSFTVNYFIKTCGFAPERAVSASKYVSFERADKPNALRAFLEEDVGFTSKQVNKLISTYPTIVLCKPKKTLLPKIEFFRSIGFTMSELPVMLLVAPNILTRSLVQHIRPTFDYLKGFIGSRDDAKMAIKRCPLIMTHLQSHIVPKIEILRRAGVPDGKIAYFLKDRPFVFLKRSDRFKESVDEIKEMVIDTTSSTFIVGVAVLASLSKVSWQEKIELYGSWGFSEDEVRGAFKRYPWFMMVSKAKIDSVMGILVNEMGVEPSKVLEKPYLLTFSLTKRIIPRCSVYRVLFSEGLTEGEVSLASLITTPEHLFLEKFVYCYEKKAPELLKLYQEKLGIAAI